MQHEDREKRVEARITDRGEHGAYKLSQPSKLEIGTLFGVVRKRGRVQEALQVSLRRVLHVVPNLQRQERDKHDPRQRGAGDGYQSTGLCALQHRLTIHFWQWSGPVFQYLTE